MSVGVPVLLVTMLGARSSEMSLKGSTVVDTVLQKNNYQMRCCFSEHLLVSD